MIYSGTSITKTLSAVVITCAVAAFYTVPAAAQTATNLNCGGCVKSKQIKNGGIKNKDLQDNAVNGQKIADGTVGNPDIAGDAVTSDKVLDNSLTGSDVATNGIPSTDISNEAAVDFTNDPGAATELSLTSTWAVMRSRAINHPSSGYVTCIAMGSIDYDSSSNSSAYLGWDNAGGTAAPESYNRARVYPPAGTTDRYIPISAMYTFQVTGAGTTTFYLKSLTLSASATSHDFAFHGLACMFFPTRA